MIFGGTLKSDILENTFTTRVIGARSSISCASIRLQETVLVNERILPKAVETLLLIFSMDHFICSEETVEQCMVLQEKLVQVLKSASTLSKWYSTQSEVTDEQIESEYASQLSVLIGTAQMVEY